MHNIRVLREKNGFSQQQVAEVVNVSQQAVARWENGLANPRADLLPQLAALFHCTIDDLFGVPDNKTPPAGPGREKQKHEYSEMGGKGLFRQRKIDRGQSTINEVREKCGLSPVEGGDIRLKKRD